MRSCDKRRIHGLDERGALEQLELFAFGQQIEPFGIAARLQVHVDRITHDSRGDLRVGFMLLFQFVELARGLTGGDGLFFNPANLALLCLDFEEVTAVVEDFQAIAVRYGSGAIAHRGHTVAQVGGLGRDVNILVRGLGLEAGAARRERQRREQDQECFAGGDSVTAKVNWKMIISS